MLQHKSKFSTGLVLDEMKAGQREELMRENNRAGRAAGAQSTADLFGRTVSSYFGKISFGVAGRLWVSSSKVPELSPISWAQDLCGKVQTQNPSSQELLFLCHLTVMVFQGAGPHLKKDLPVGDLATGSSQGGAEPSQP